MRLLDASSPGRLSGPLGTASPDAGSVGGLSILAGLAGQTAGGDRKSLDGFHQRGGGQWSISAAQLLSRYFPQRPVLMEARLSTGAARTELMDSPNLSFRSGTVQVIMAGTWFFRSAVQSIAAPLSSIQADRFMSHMGHRTRSSVAAIVWPTFASL